MKWAGHDSINENTGLTYMQARWMDNNTGRFISMDPIKDGYNWYAYCAGNPVTYTDPTGLFGQIGAYEKPINEPVDVQEDAVDSFYFDESLFDTRDYTGTWGFGTLSSNGNGNGGGWSFPHGMQASEPVNLKELLLPYGHQFIKDKTVKEPPIKPCMQAMQQRYDKLRAAYNGAVYAMLVERLKNEPYVGNDDSRDAYDTGNTLSEEEQYEKFRTNYAYLPEYARDQLSYQDYDRHVNTLYDDVMGYERTFTEFEKYIGKTMRFIVFGEFNEEDEVTVPGLIFMVVLGLAGLDLPADIRDILGSLNKGDYFTALSTIVCLLPLVGVLKYADEGLSLSKAGKSIVKPVTEGFNKHAADLVEHIVEFGCFTAGTPVLTEEGNKPIEEIKEGDLVYAKNVKTGEVGLKEVTRAYVRDIHRIFHIYTENEHIETTNEHPIWVVGKGFVTAEELREGDILELQDGSTIKLVKLEVEHLDEPVKVYNFTVADWHTYYVGEDSVLVHNNNPCAEAMGEIIEEITKITNKFGNHKCDEAAAAVKKHLTKKGIKGEEVVMKYVGNTPTKYVFSETYGTIENISETGMHMGIKVGDLVFDNIHKSGIPYDDWLNDFYSFGTQTITKTKF